MVALLIALIYFFKDQVSLHHKGHGSSHGQSFGWWTFQNGSELLAKQSASKTFLYHEDVTDIESRWC